MSAVSSSSSTYTDLVLCIDGDLIAAGPGRESEPVFNPATGEVLGRLPHATPADLDRALAAAERGFRQWRDTSAYDRSRILRAAADLIRRRKDRIARILTLEQGKPLREADGEVAFSADVIDWYAEEGRRAYGRVVPSRSPDLRHIVLVEPVGPAVAFTPWNFPALTPARKIGGALAAGCSLILKAAEETPGTAVELVRAFRDAGLPDGVLSLCFGVPAQLSEHLIGSDIVRKVSFTGSVPVGRLLSRMAADGGKRTTMELGGHGPVLVFDDADPEAAAEALAAGKFRNAGQVCISPTRFYVQKGGYDRFVARFVEAAKSLGLGNGLDDGTGMGPLVNQRRLETMERLAADAVEKGAVLRAGGKRAGNIGFFFEPTVLTEVPDSAQVMTEEPFGPIAPIMPFADLEDGLAKANALPFGLAAYAFTGSQRTASALMTRLESGMVGINTLGVSNPETPFGGVKDSGHGLEGGIEGLQAYQAVKFVAQM